MMQLTPPNNDRYAARAAILKALAHPTRLWIVETLAQGERCVCELTEPTGADISTISKHLALLKNTGIVDCEKRGLQVYYRLKVPCVLQFFNCLEAVLGSRAAGGACQCNNLRAQGALPLGGCDLVLEK